MSNGPAHDADGVVYGFPDNGGVLLFPCHVGPLTDLMDQ
jgi:hypothetical protein